MALKREVLGWLIEATDTSPIIMKDLATTNRTCVVGCGQRRSQLHPFSCSNARAHRAKLWCKTQKRQLTPAEILGTPEGG